MTVPGAHAGDANPVYEAIRSRRVTRRMSSRPVDPRQLDLVVRAARYAPNAGNRRLQPVHVVTEAVQLRRLRMISPGMLPVPHAAIVVCIDRHRASDYGMRPDAAGLYIDVGTTAATLLLAAHALGLAACPVTSFSRAAAARLLGLDAGIVPRLIVCLGHADGDQPPAVGTWPVATGGRRD